MAAGHGLPAGGALMELDRYEGVFLQAWCADCSPGGGMVLVGAAFWYGVLKDGDEKYSPVLRHAHETGHAVVVTKTPGADLVPRKEKR